MNQTETGIRIDLKNASPQEVLIEAVGPDVMLIEGKAPADADPDALMPDWMGMIARAANLGMMSGASFAPRTSRFSIIKEEFDAAAARIRWHVKLENVDAGIFLVIINLLKARQLRSFSLKTVSANANAPALDPASLKYPDRYRELPFPVEQEEPLRSSKDRKIQITFRAPPADPVATSIMEVFDFWGQLLVLAAYADEDQHPRDAKTLPEFADWTDDVTVEQYFEEFFDSDTASFNAIVNWADTLHRSGTKVEKIYIH
jgi:hypothetical protein